MKNWIREIWSMEGITLLLIATFINGLIALIYENQYLMIYSGIAWGFISIICNIMLIQDSVKIIIKRKRISDRNDEFKRLHKEKYDD